MPGIVLVVIVGLIAGVAIAIQSPLTSMIGQRLGVLESVFIIHMGGAIAAALPLLMQGGGNLGQWRTLPWYALVAGVSGLIVLSAINYAYPRVGAASTTFLIVAGNLIVSVAFDHFGLLGTMVRPIDLTRLIGMAVLLFGIWLIVR